MNANSVDDEALQFALGEYEAQYDIGDEDHKVAFKKALEVYLSMVAIKKEGFYVPF